MKFYEKAPLHYGATFFPNLPVDINLVRLLLEDLNGTITSNDILRIGSLQFFVRTMATMRAIVIGADGTLLGYTGHVDVPNLNIGQPFDPGDLSRFGSTLYCSNGGRNGCEIPL